MQNQVQSSPPASYDPSGLPVGYTFDGLSPQTRNSKLFDVNLATNRANDAPNLNGYFDFSSQAAAHNGDFRFRKHKLDDAHGEELDPQPSKKYITEVEMSQHFSSMNINLQMLHNNSNSSYYEPVYDPSPVLNGNNGIAAVSSGVEIVELDDNDQPLQRLARVCSPMTDDEMPVNLFDRKLCSIDKKLTLSNELKKHLTNNKWETCDSQMLDSITKKQVKGNELILYRCPPRVSSPTPVITDSMKQKEDDEANDDGLLMEPHSIFMSEQLEPMED